MLALLDLDPNVVKPGWTPLLITIALAAAMVVLFFSLRKQFKKIDGNFPAPTAPEASAPETAAPQEPAPKV